MGSRGWGVGSGVQEMVVGEEEIKDGARREIACDGSNTGDQKHAQVNPEKKNNHNISPHHPTQHRNKNPIKKTHKLTHGCKATPFFLVGTLEAWIVGGAADISVVDCYYPT